ncbi:MAG: hypothetical protein R3D57_12680 [Hyphomicrobiaceae bacterium]
MMKKLMITAGALAVAATMATAPAQAGGYGKVYFGKHVHVTFYGGGCYWMKKKALRAEYRGQWHRAQYWWDRYWDCKNGYSY